MEVSNMDLWDRVSKTNPAHTKKVTFGRAITAIDPYRQIEAATREFGPAGQGWGWSVKQVEHLPTNEVAVLVNVWIKDKLSNDNGSIEQWGQASLYIDKNEKMKDKDLMKKATTDGLTKCLSCMGFNADIFLGKFDDNKYIQEMEQAFKEKPVFTSGMYDSMLEKFTAAIATNERTPDQIISNLEEKYDVCDGTKKRIRGIK
jgi:hypothetical protein